MIIKNVCLLLEALSVVICLHHLYGEKFRLDIATVSFLSIDMIIMSVINYFEIARIQTMVIYPIIILYCGFRFGFKLKSIILNIILCVILVGGIQMLGTLLIYFLFGIQDYSDLKLLILSCIVFACVLIVFPLLKINRLAKFSKDNSKIVLLVISVCLAWISFWMLSYKNIKSLELKEALMLFVSIVLVLVLAAQLNKYKIRAKEIEIELKMHELYSEPFQGLIDNIRLKQHEFDNHINAIYSQHLLCDTLEELIKVQKSYCEHITKNNRFNRLLAQDNSIIRGFLYTRFIQIDKMGIEISYQVTINKLNVGIPTYKIIELLGDLINNAVEALSSDEKRKKLHIAIVETNKFYIEVRNESPYIAYDVLGNFFNKGYSKKGENRGLGLYNVKQICEEYGLEVASECEEIDGENWLSFKVWKDGDKLDGPGMD